MAEVQRATVYFACKFIVTLFAWLDRLAGFLTLEYYANVWLSGRM